MNIRIYTALALLVFSSGVQAAGEGVFIPGFSKEQIDESRRKAVEAANSAVNPQEDIAPTNSGARPPYQQVENYGALQATPSSGPHGTQSQSSNATPQWNNTPTYSAPAMPQYNNTFNNFGGAGGFSGSSTMPVMPAAPVTIPASR